MQMVLNDTQTTKKYILTAFGVTRLVHVSLKEVLSFWRYGVLKEGISPAASPANVGVCRAIQWKHLGEVPVSQRTSPSAYLLFSHDSYYSAMDFIQAPVASLNLSPSFLFSFFFVFGPLHHVPIRENDPLNVAVDATLIVSCDNDSQSGELFRGRSGLFYPQQMCVHWVISEYDIMVARWRSFWALWVGHLFLDGRTLFCLWGDTIHPAAVIVCIGPLLRKGLCRKRRDRPGNSSYLMSRSDLMHTAKLDRAIKVIPSRVGMTMRTISWSEGTEKLGNSNGINMSVCGSLCGRSWCWGTVCRSATDYQGDIFGSLSGQKEFLKEKMSCCLSLSFSLSLSITPPGFLSETAALQTSNHQQCHWVCFSPIRSTRSSSCGWVALSWFINRPPL